jgi:hypothetical protein
VNAPSYDPLLHDIDLPLTQVFHPLGFPLRIATNSPEVLRAAAISWSAFPKLFNEPPIQLRVVVTGSGTAAPPAEPPVYRGQAHLLTIAAGPCDAGVADLARGFSFAYVTPAVAANTAYLRYFFLEALAYATLASLHLTVVHAACVSFDGRAILLCGSSGAGKSTLAYACARRGFTYLSDDATSFLRRGAGRTVIGKPMGMRLRPNAREIFPELRGLPAWPAANGKESIEIDTASLPGIVTAFTSQVEAVIFLNRVAGFDPHCIAISRHEARKRLAQEIPVLENSAWREQMASLDVLLEADTFELRYAEAGHAVAALEELLRKRQRDADGLQRGPASGLPPPDVQAAREC